MYALPKQQFDPGTALAAVLRSLLFLGLLSCLQVLPAQAREPQADKAPLHILIDEGRQAAVGEVDRELTSAATTSIEATRFRHRLLSLSEVLQQEVGVQVRSTGGHGSPATMQLRGASAEQVMIYLDGVPLNSAAGGAVDLGMIPLDSIERIDVYRGSTPLELGNAAIGGAVNIISRKQADAEKGGAGNSLSASLASFGTARLAATTQQQARDDELLLGASYLQSENDFSFNNDNGTPDNPADDRIEKRQNDGLRQLSLLGNWTHRFDARSESRVRFDLNDRYKEVPDVGNSANMQTYVDTRQYNLLAELRQRRLYQSDADAALRLFASRKDEVFDDSLAQLGFINQRSESRYRRLGTQLFLQAPAGSSQWKLLGIYSLETYANDSTAARIEGADSRRNSLELALQNSSAAFDNRLLLDLVLRALSSRDRVADGTDIAGRPVQGYSREQDFVNPQLGLKYRFDASSSLDINIGRYSRLPSFYELFGGQGLVLGNPDLKRETALNSDIGLHYQWFEAGRWWHRAGFYAGVFYNRVQDLIVQIYNGQGVARSENISDALIRGLETTLKLQPPAGAFGRHSLDVSYSLTDSINDSDIASFDGNSLPNYYRHNLAVRYAWRLHDYLYRLEAELLRDMYYDRSNLLRGDDVNLINTGVRVYLASASLDFMANNLLDENIRYYRNRPTPGLNFSLTYSTVF